MAAAAAAAKAAAAAAVAGWKEYLTADGKKYYHSAATRTTQWAAPPGWQLAAMAAARAGNAMRRIDTKCAVVMRVREYSLRAAPPGWQLAAMPRRAPVMQCGVREILVLMQCGMRRVRVLPERSKALGPAKIFLTDENDAHLVVPRGYGSSRAMRLGGEKGKLLS